MTSGFDLWHPDGLLYEDHPELFLLLDRNPIVWTVRGLRYFKPRFALLGVDITAIKTRTHFDAACSAWLRIERTLIEGRVRRKASRADAKPEDLVLRHILDGDLASAERLIAQLEQDARHGAS